MFKNTFQKMKIIAIILLIGSSLAAQAFYPEPEPTTFDRVFTATGKLSNFVISSKFFTSNLVSANKFITKQGIVLTPTNNVTI